MAQVFNHRTFIAVLKDGTTWEACTPLVRFTADGDEYHAIIAMHWDADGKLMSFSVAQYPGVEYLVTDTQVFYWPRYMSPNAPTDDGVKETAH